MAKQANFAFLLLVEAFTLLYVQYDRSGGLRMTKDSFEAVGLWEPDVQQLMSADKYPKDYLIFIK